MQCKQQTMQKQRRQMMKVLQYLKYIKKKNAEKKILHFFWVDERSIFKPLDYFPIT
jgi:hypothetical protein